MSDAVPFPESVVHGLYLRNNLAYRISFLELLPKFSRDQAFRSRYGKSTLIIEGGTFRNNAALAYGGSRSVAGELTVVQIRGACSPTTQHRKPATPKTEVDPGVVFFLGAPSLL